MTKHTQRNWELLGKDGDQYVIAHNDKGFKKRTLAHVYNEANARLIASAPELLEALK